MKKVIYLSLLTILFFISCNKRENEISNNSFSLEEVKLVIIEKSKLWNKGLQSKDVNVFLNLYDKDGHYIPDSEMAIHGNEAIAEFWKNSWDFVKSVNLNMETLEGIEELIYETGNGTAKILNEKGENYILKFKYVNVWKKQLDGTYKVVIDTYNNIKDE